MSILFIIGAPRSGTNLLRDLLCQQPNLFTWPCDEINYIWRIGRPLKESDTFKNGFNSFQSKYIISKFKDRFDFSSNITDLTLDPILVEKTCANCLRVVPIYDLFPDAKFIYLKRDPYDAVYSSILRWTGTFDVRYIFQKARFIPKRDIFRYAYSFLSNRLLQVFSSDKQLKQWGPILDESLSFQDLNRLEEICTVQWFMCNHFASLSFEDASKFNHHNFYSLTYEDLISNPFTSLSNLFNSLSIQFNQNTLYESTKMIHTNSVGKGKASLKSNQKTAIKNTLALCQAKVFPSKLNIYN